MANTNIWEKVIKQAVGAAADWPVTTALDLLLNIFEEDISAINSKLDKLIESPFKEGVLILRDAKLSRSKKSECKLYEDAIGKFRKASVIIEGDLKSVESLLYGSYCWYMLGENKLAEAWLIDAYSKVKGLYRERVDKGNEENLKDPLWWITLFSAIGGSTLTYGGSLFLIGSLVVSAPILPALLPLGAGIGLFGVAGGSSRLSKFWQNSESYKKIKEVKEVRDSYIFAPLKNQNIPFEARTITQKQIDFNDLNNLLKNHDWQAANQETENLILDIIDRELHAYFLSSKDIHSIPCAVLHTIDTLWKDHSRDLFGFSIQDEIYKETRKSFEKYKKEIGVPENQEACKGYFPKCIRVLGITQTRTKMMGNAAYSEIIHVLDKRLLESLFSRLKTCRI